MIATGVSLNLWADLSEIWSYAFMRNALEAGTAVAIVAGAVGWFVVLRRSAFAAHALSHGGFAGAAGAAVLGLNPVLGLLCFCLVGGVAMGAMGRDVSERDTTIGAILAFSLGLGALFLSLYNGYADETFSLLFGSILGVSSNDVVVTVIIAAVTLVLTAIVFRPLLFASIDQEVAAARGVAVRGLSIAFMVLLALVIAVSVQVVGVLLIFSLLVTPAATAAMMSARPRVALLVSVALAVGTTWAGLIAGYYWPYPVSFFITTISFVLYLAIRVTRSVMDRRQRRVAGRHAHH
jgi:zinc/manganese transport system permease protein